MNRFLIFCLCDFDKTGVGIGFVAVIHEPDGPTPHSQFEHSSIPATVKKLFNLKSHFLTKRDAWAGTFEKYFRIRDSPRQDCPGLLHSPPDFPVHYLILVRFALNPCVT